MTWILLLYLVFPNGQVATQTATFRHKAACQYAIAAVQNPTTQFQPENVPYVVGFCVEDTNVEPALPTCVTRTFNGRSIVECED